MSKEIEIDAERKKTHIEELCHRIIVMQRGDRMLYQTLKSLDDLQLRALSDMIFVAAIKDADAIRRDANFAANKLSEALERTTRMLEQMAKPIESAIKIDLPPIPTPFGKEG